MGTIEKRGENTWRVGFRRSTAQRRAWVRRTITFDPDVPEDEQRRACELELARLLVDDAEGRLADPLPAPQVSEDAVTVMQLYDRWMVLHCIPNLKPTTVKTYQSMMLSRVIPAIGTRTVASLTPMDIEELMRTIRQSPRQTTAVAPEDRKRRQDRTREDKSPRQLSSRTIQHYYDTLADMFDRGVQWGMIDRSPMDRVVRPTAKRRKLTVLDDDRAVELLRMLAKEESMSFRSAVMLALLCGLRLGEVCALRWQDVDMDAGTIHVRQGVSYAPGYGNYFDTPKSEDGDRIIALPDGMMDMLRETKAQQDDTARTLGDRWRGDDRIVCGWDGAPMHHDTPSKQFRKFADRHGFEGVRFHDLRHTHATLLLANNLDAVAVSHRLGHASPDTTYRFYAHAIRSRDAASADAMQHYLDIASTPTTDDDTVQDTPAKA